MREIGNDEKFLSFLVHEHINRIDWNTSSSSWFTFEHAIDNWRWNRMRNPAGPFSFYRVNDEWSSIHQHCLLWWSVTSRYFDCQCVKTLNDTRVNTAYSLSLLSFWLNTCSSLSLFRLISRLRERRKWREKRKKQGSVQKEDRDVHQMHALARRSLSPFFSSLLFCSLCYTSMKRETLLTLVRLCRSWRERKKERVLLSSRSMKDVLRVPARCRCSCPFSFPFRWTTNDHDDDNQHVELNFIEWCEYLCLSFGYAFWSLMDKLTR